MKLYTISQADWRFLGFSPSQMNQNLFYNRNKLMTYFVLGLACVLTSMFVMYEAKIFVEYVEAIYIFLAGFGSIGILATLRADMMSKYIEALESMVIYSECIQLFGNKNTRLNAKFFILKNRKIIDTNNTLR